MMLLASPNGNALIPFPCKVYTERATTAIEDVTKLKPDAGPLATKTIYRIVADGVVMARYDSIVPAKMEIARLKDAYQKGEMGPDVFTFMKEETE